MPVAAVNVLKEILKWSLDRPPWQRDALRRLVTQGDLKQEDITALASLCKSRHGLSDKVKAQPLDANHLPQPDAGKIPVFLESLTHLAGVNALGQDQRIEFERSLTVVYGANAAGKSGYTRILKRACRARGAEEILGNVVSGAAPGRPSAKIKFTADGKSRDILWDDDKPPDAFLSRVSVFDRHCASVYIAERTDVAFRPLGLDLFDRLSDASEAIKKALEKERKELAAQTLAFPEVAQETKVHELIADLTSLTAPTVVKELASLTTIEQTRLEELRKRLHDLQSDDPEKSARTLELRAKRAETLRERVDAATAVLSDSAITALFSARDRMCETQQVAEEMRRASFEDQSLPNTGSAVWRTLWAAAERFSSAEAYPDRPFPVTEPDARCVLCQQELQDDGVQRLRRFQEFLNSAVQRDHDKAASEYDERREQIAEAVLLDSAATEVIDELQLDDASLADATRLCLEAAEARRTAVTKALAEQLPCPDSLPTNPLKKDALTVYTNGLRDRAKELRESGQPDALALIERELHELEARKILAEHLAVVLDEIERKKKIAAYQLCLDETRTTAITRKSTEVTKRAVSDQLAKRFAEELRALRFDHVEVQMVPAGGSRGSLYHKLELKRAPGVEVPRVVSEGEARCLSIASFFAELSTAADHSAILFDDPVSSLDHHWRGDVAKRLVVESRSRQVVVFTHDIVFLLALAAEAKELGVEVKHQYLRRDRTATGLSSQQLPWPAMKVKSRIGHLKNLWQAAEKSHRDGEQDQYEREASRIYGLLREAWERGIEEVLLGGVVERYRVGVQTQQAKHLSDICDNDCTTLEAGMTKCSRWLPGHDQAAAENPRFPEPDEVKDDIEILEKWVKAIQKRR